MDLRASYDVNVNRSSSTAVLRALSLKGTQNGSSILNGELTSPMTVAWGNASGAVGDSSLNIAVTHLDLANWKAFLGEVAPAGDVNLKLQLTSKQSGKNLAFDLASQIANLTAGSGSNRLTQATVTLDARGEAVDFKQFSLPAYQFQVSQANQVLAAASGSGTYDQAAGNADFQLSAQLMLARLLQALPQPSVNLSSGTSELKLHITQKPLGQATSGNPPPVAQNVTGSFALADLSGHIGSTTLQKFGTTADLDLGATPDQVQIRKLAGQITEAQAVGGKFECTGSYGLSNKAAQLTAKLINFNQDGLRPFLEPALGGKKLSSVSVNANSTVQYDPQGASVVKADLQVTNLVVKDPKGQFPAIPLSAGAKADLSLNKQVADIKLLELALTPTARGSNVVQLAGHVDMTQTNAIQGNLKLTADSLDLTSYYDLFTGQAKPVEKPASASVVQPTPTTSPGSAIEKEPEPQQFPMRNFVAEANIRRAYLHEVEVADFQTSVKVDGGHVVLNPFKLTLNGAPVSSTIDADMGVPGYKYAFTFNAQAIPLAPLVNSFQPDRKGQLAGTLTAQAQINGQGITGASLQKNLAGQFDVGSTNLNLAVVNIRNPMLRTLINVVALVP
ncbi:MAG TPA: AsmA family protein, partial [Verrucomicrobiae bacterium]|nr:AsmA family protein [Verrucomicrobiae bacterium]